MRVSYNWLKEFVDFDLTPQDLAQRLTLRGVSVETVEKVNPGLEGVVTGRVESIERLPQAGRLWVTRVDVGSTKGGRTGGTKGHLLQVVTGADNVRAGDIVPVAPPGAKLPGARVMERAEFRGVVSEGMLCALTEIMEGKGHAEGEGILILPEDTPVGADAADVLGLNDWVLDLDLTPNYASHCLSLIGVAREVAAMVGAGAGEGGGASGNGNGGSGGAGAVRVPEVAADIGNPRAGKQEVPSLAKVDIDDLDRCPRYAALMLADVKVGPSPLWLQMRLFTAGIRPHNNVVDVTNLVMLECGQPLHAFDYDTLAGYRIIVRRAREGERLVTLDGKERELDHETLVIADQERAVGLAGVMGGQNTEVSDATRTILLEAAYFTPVGIRRTAVKLGLFSDAASRFSKGLDPNGNLWAARRAIALMAEIGAGTPVPGAIDAGVPVYPPKKAHLRLRRMNALLGTRLSEDEAAGYLARLGLAVRAVEGKAGDAGLLEVEIPSRRPDLDGEIDLVEEVARQHGYNRIATTLPRGKVTAARRSRADRLTKTVRDLLAGAGYHEALTYSWYHPDTLDKLGFAADAPERRHVAIMNPMTEDGRLLRTTILPGLLGALAYNAARKVNDVRLFEVARVYLPKQLPLTELPEEPMRLGLAAMGPARPKTWDGPAQEVDFFALSGAVGLVLDGLGVKGWRLEAARHPSLHPGRTARLVLAAGGQGDGGAGGREAGYLGEVHPVVSQRYDLPSRVYLAELDFTAILAQARLDVRFEPVPKHPAVARDLAFVVDKSVSQDRLAATMRRAGGELLDGLRLFDLYEGAPVRAGSHSLAYTLVYRAPDRTLTDVEVTEAHDRVRAALAREHGAELRS